MNASESFHRSGSRKNAQVIIFPTTTVNMDYATGSRISKVVPSGLVLIMRILP